MLKDFCGSWNRATAGGVPSEAWAPAPAALTTTGRFGAAAAAGAVRCRRATAERFTGLRAAGFAGRGASTLTGGKTPGSPFCA
ncbi:hypothetical protein JCM18382A_57800 [Bradyrhizobium sp. 17-4]